MEAHARDGPIATTCAAVGNPFTILLRLVVRFLQQGGRHLFHAQSVEETVHHLLEGARFSADCVWRIGSAPMPCIKR